MTAGTGNDKNGIRFTLPAAESEECLDVRPISQMTQTKIRNIMEKKSRIFLAFLTGSLFYGYYPVHAQHPSEVSEQISKLMPKPVQKTPNVSAMEKYGDYEVNLYHGLPEISIPLFEITSGSLRLPISLSYHASGIRYTDQATWAGLGWTVNAGGQISRTVQGKPDESTGTNAGYLNSTNNYFIQSPGCTNTNDMFYRQQLAKGQSDREPDIFSYNFPGKSGKFYLGQNGAPPYLFPESPVRITHSGVNFFDITDENGIRYRFGRNASGINAVESTHSQSGGGNSSLHLTAWHLMEVHSPDSDDLIQITYQTVGTVLLEDVEQNISISDQCNSENSIVLPCPNLFSSVTDMTTYSSTTQLGINEIIFKTGKVKFVLGPNRQDLPFSTNVKKLDRIEIYQKEGNGYVLFRTYQLQNSNYFTRSGTTQKLRLRLDGLTVKDGANTEINNYSFSYYTNSFSWDVANFSKRRDLFGFYNGRNNSNLIPQRTISYQFTLSTQTSNITIGGANRDPDTLYLKEGVLRKINFPTKGFTEFDYEPHRYSDGGQTKYGGGLRVKRITRNTGTSSAVKEYRYGNGENGLGIKNFNQDAYFFHTTQLMRAWESNPDGSPQREYRARMYFSSSNIGLGYEDSPVVYPEVAVYEGGTINNGKTNYEFDNNTHISDYIYPIPGTNKFLRNSMSWARGKLTQKTAYNSTGTPVSKTVINYQLLKNQTKNISQAGFQYIVGDYKFPGIDKCVTTNLLVSEDNDGWSYLIANFAKTTGVYLESQRTETLYSNGLADHVTTHVREYDPVYLQPIHEEIQASTNPEAKVTKYRYPFNLVNTSLSYTGTPNILKQMVLKNMLSNPVEQYVVIQNANGTNQRVVSGQLTTFRNIGFSRYKADSIFILEMSAPVGIAGFASSAAGTSTGWIIKDNRYRHRLRFTAYDSRGNPAQINKTDAVPLSYLWAYEGTHAVAEVSNATLSQIAYTSFETVEKGGWNYSGPELKLSQGDAKTGRNAYLLDNGTLSRTVSGASSSNKFMVSFWARSESGNLSWSFMNITENLSTAWKLIEREVTSSSFSISGSGIYIDELRIAPASSLMTTFTYRPLMGISSQMDPANRGSYYFYDHFGRLEYIRNEDGHLTGLNEYTYIKNP